MRTVAGSILGSGNILSWRLVIKLFLLSFSPYHWFTHGSCQLLAKGYAVNRIVLVNRIGSLPRSSVVMLPDHLDMTIVVNWDIKPQIVQNKNTSEPPHDKTNKMVCAPSEDSDQPGHPPSLIRVFTVRTKKPCFLSYPLSAQQRLIWVFAGNKIILLVLSCGGSSGTYTTVLSLSFVFLMIFKLKGSSLISRVYNVLVRL